MNRPFDKFPICCAVCRREAGGFGYMNKGRGPIAWLCDEPECHPLGRVVYHMPAKHLSVIEAHALSDAGDKAGEYLGSIGKTDLASLSREEWITFLKTFLTGFEENMRDRLTSDAAPF